MILQGGVIIFFVYWDAVWRWGPFRFASVYWASRDKSNFIVCLIPTVMINGSIQ